jgi:hypothetical protein
MYPDPNELHPNEIVSEPEESIENKIRDLLEKKPHTSREILKKIETGWSSVKLRTYLKKLDFVEVVKKGGSNFFRIKGSILDRDLKLFS